MRALLTAQLSVPFPRLEDRSKHFSEIMWIAGMTFDHASDPQNPAYAETVRETLIDQLSRVDQPLARQYFVSLLYLSEESTWGLAFSATADIAIRLFNPDVTKLQSACDFLVRKVRERTPVDARLTLARDIEVREVANDREVFAGR